MTVTLPLAIRTIQANRREEGRQLLNLLIQQNPNDEAAWLWMSEVVETDEHRAKCLYHVLAINPNSTVARHGLKRLGVQVSDTRPVKVVDIDSDVVPPSTNENGAEHAQPTIRYEPDTNQADTETPPESSAPLDSKEITKELPFTPVREPFSTSETDSQADDDSVEVTIPQNNHRLRELTMALLVEEGELDPNAPLTLDVLPHANEQPTDHAATTIGMTPYMAGDNPTMNGSLASDMNGDVTNEVEIATDKMDSQPTPVTASKPVGGLPLPDFDAALSQLNQTPIPNSNNFTHPSQPIPVVLSHSHAMRPVVGSPLNGINDSNGQSTPILTMPGYVSPSHPTRPVALNAQSFSNGAMFSQVQTPNGPMMVQLTRPSMPYQPQQPTMGMPMSAYPSQPIPIVHSNTTMGMPYTAQNHYSQPVPGLHSNATMGMPQQEASGNGMNSGLSSDQALIAAWQSGTHQPQPASNNQVEEEYAEEEEEVNMFIVSIFVFLTFTGLGGFGILTILTVTMQ
ncbi:hypothetical protein QUF63_06785 [Anaerolineales bacterium HSG25]|nr:hypothetical protein [Anaerolineales bacterium HSG25]